MLSDDEKRELKELINLMYNNHISQYGKRKLEKYIKKQSKEIEKLNKSDESKEQSSMKYYNLYKELVDKIKAKIEELEAAYEDDYIIKILQSLL